MEEERALTLVSVPEGFKKGKVEYGDFGFKAWKEYGDSVKIELKYEERTDSFKPDCPSVEINLEVPYTNTDH